jgi:CopG family nickel-responsive transcriptional regulator
MPIIAVSMNDQDLEDLTKLEKEGKFSNRSDVVRHALQDLMSKHRDIESVKGSVTAVITAVYYKTGQGHNISSVQHEYREYIIATIHAHTTDGHCTEVMILTTDADTILEFFKKLRSQKKVMKVDINIVGGGN